MMGDNSFWFVDYKFESASSLRGQDVKMYCTYNYSITLVNQNSFVPSPRTLSSVVNVIGFKIFAL